MKKSGIEQQISICKDIANWKKPAWIMKKYSLSEGNISFYKNSNRWKGLIQRFRKDLASQIMNVPIAHKKVRLDRLEKAYQDLEGDHLPTGEKVRKQVAVLAEARQEMDEAKTHIHNLYITNVNTMSDEQLIAKRNQLLESIKAIDIGGNGAKQDGKTEKVLRSGVTEAEVREEDKDRAGKQVPA